jgi:hypothetical protein
MPDRFWPARRWLADRLVGRQAYHRNVAVHPLEPRIVPAGVYFLPSDLVREGPTGEAWFTAQPPVRLDRNPQETA